MTPLPCPYCEAPRPFVETLDGGAARVVCINCDAYGPTERPAERAVETWNRVAEATKVGASPTDSCDIHGWFELTYAQYLTVPRSVLQSMPDAWQQRFVALMEQLDETIDWRPKSGGRYWVQLRNTHGRFVEDPLMDYERGRRQVPHRGEQGV